jgi:hypothetical protein
MRRGRLLAGIVFISLVAENDTVLAYYREMWTPARLLEWFTAPLPIKLTVFQIACLALLLTGKKMPTARPITAAMQMSAATVVLMALYGLGQGGLLQPIYTQVIAWASCLVYVVTATRVLATVDDFVSVENAIVWAGIWRSCVAIVFYMRVYGRDWTTMPGYMTTHEDTVVFVVSLSILISRAVNLRTKRAFRIAATVAPLILLAIQFNNRRLAWASLAAGLLALYAVIPAKSKVARKVNRWLIRVTPVLVLYAAIGWGRPEKIFKPLQAFSSMGAGQIDNSTRARINENISLLTMINQRPLLGTGLGHQWVELDSTYTVPLTTFPMYHYCPHNNVLAFIAFLGGIGFAALWMVIPISMCLNARTYRLARDPAVRSVAVVGIVEAIAYLNQAYGDMGAMGATHILVGTILGTGIAASARLSVLSGAWPTVLPRKS